MATTQQTRQSKEQSRHLEKIEQYKKNHANKKYIVWGIIFIVFLFSFCGQIRAFKEVHIYATVLIIIGLATDIANIFIEAAIAVDRFSKQQRENKEQIPQGLEKKEYEKRLNARKNCEFKELLPIPQSFLHYAKMIWGVRVFWILLVGYSIYIGSISRNKTDFAVTDTEISTLENQRISTNNLTISEEKERQDSLKILNKELSLQKQKKADVEAEARNNDWLLRTRYFTRHNSAKSKIENIEAQIKTLKPKKMTVAEIDNQKAIEARIIYLKEEKLKKTEQSDFDRNTDIIVHILLMLISMTAIFFSVKELVRYLIHTGYYHENIEIVEQSITPSVKPEPQSKILKEALQGLTYKNKKGIEKNTTIEIFMSWKNTGNAKYLEAVKQIEAKGYIVAENLDAPTGYPNIRR